MMTSRILWRLAHEASLVVALALTQSAVAQDVPVPSPTSPVPSAPSASPVPRPLRSPCEQVVAATGDPIWIRRLSESINVAFVADPHATCVATGLAHLERALAVLHEPFTNDILVSARLIGGESHVEHEQTQIVAMLLESEALLAPVITAHRARRVTRAFAMAREQIARRWREGVARGAALAPADFRRAIVDPDAFALPHTCQIVRVGALRPVMAIDNPPEGRPLHLTVVCDDWAGHSAHVRVWVTRAEAEAALDWTSETNIGVRVVRVAIAGTPEAVIDEGQSRELERLSRLDGLFPTWGG